MRYVSLCFFWTWPRLILERNMFILSKGKKRFYNEYDYYEKYSLFQCQQIYQPILLFNCHEHQLNYMRVECISILFLLKPLISKVSSSREDQVRAWKMLQDALNVKRRKAFRSLEDWQCNGVDHESNYNAVVASFKRTEERHAAFVARRIVDWS